MKTSLRQFLVAFASFFILLPCAFPQGSLTPPGPPAATMRSLDQIEPRRPLGSLFTPGDANYAFIISQPGSYYLPARIAISGPNGIHITAAGVTLDLEGFDIGRQTGSGGDGITVDGTAHRCTVKNGTISGFSYGIQCVIAGSYARGCSFRDLAVANCTTAGIWAGQGAVLESCRAHANSGQHGLFAAFGSLLINCTATSNTAGDGIFAGAGSSVINCSASANVGTGGIITAQGCALINCSALSNSGTFGINTGEHSTLINCSVRQNTVTNGILADKGSNLLNCTASFNTSAASASYGIQTEDKCTIIGCSSSENMTSNGTPTDSTGGGILTGAASTVKDCTVVDNSGDGIAVGVGSTVTGCTLRGNNFDGIEGANDCVITRNNCTANGDGTGVLDGAGIHTRLAGNRIEENQSIVNDIGYKVDVGESFIARNTARFNASNWNIANDNRFGPVVDMTGGVAGGFVGNGAATTMPAAADHPWANFSY
jgi:hypothetical protein